MSIPFDVWRTRTKRIGSCAAPRLFPGPQMRQSATISTCISSISISLNLIVSGLLRFWFCLGGFRVPALPYLLKSTIIFLNCFTEFAIMSTSSAKRTLLSSLSLMPKLFSFQVSTSFSTAEWRTEMKRRLLKGSPCFVPRAIPYSSLSLWRLCFCLLFCNPPFCAHGHRKCAVPDLWSLPK